jgi:hypothetical protein
LDHPDWTQDVVSGKFLGDAEQEYQKVRQNYVDQAINQTRGDAYKIRYGAGGMGGGGGFGGGGGGEGWTPVGTPAWIKPGTSDVQLYRDYQANGELPGTSAYNLAFNLMMDVENRDPGKFVDHTFKMMEDFPDQYQTHAQVPERYLNSMETSNNPEDVKFFQDVEKELNRRSEGSGERIKEKIPPKEEKKPTTEVSEIPKAVESTPQQMRLENFPNRSQTGYGNFTNPGVTFQERMSQFRYGINAMLNELREQYAEFAGRKSEGFERDAKTIQKSLDNISEKITPSLKKMGEPFRKASKEEIKRKMGM